MSTNSQELRNRIGFLAMSGGTFMAVLDTQIVAGSLPKIAASIGATIEEASWIQTAYMIAEVIMIPLAGWLSRSLSLRNLYSLAAFLFTLASLFCAFSWSIESLIFLRIFQGICSGILTPLLYQGIYLLLPRERQARATLFAVMIISLAPVVGPTLGGWITETWSWRWLFFINLLPGLIVSGVVFGLVRGREPEWALLKNFDFPGILLIVLFLGSLEYVLGEGSDKDWFNSQRIIFFTAVSAVSAVLMVWRELTCRHPVVCLRTFSRATFSVGCLFNFMMGLGLFGSGYLMTLFLGTVKHYDSMQIGRVMAVPGIAMIVSLPFARLASRYFGMMITLALGLGMFCSAFWLNSSMTAETGFDQLLFPQILRGMGIIFCLSPITQLALGQLPVDVVPNATGLYSLMRSLGGGIGIALINIMVEQRVWFHHRHLAESLNPFRFTEFVENFNSSGRAVDPAEAQQGVIKVLITLVNRESLVMAYNDVWLIVAVFLGIMFILVPVARKVRTPA